MCKRKGSRGVTLFELCLSMALVAVLASLAVPGFRVSLRTAALRSAVLELAAGLQQTRANSIVRARPGALCLSDATGKCLAGMDSSDAWSAFLDVNGHAEPIAGQVLPAGLVIRATRPRLNFWPDARATSTGTLTVCDTQGLAPPRAIVLSQGGRVRLAAASASDCRA
jgi:type IV fimbrial biogenesis protein FimT